MSTPEQPLGPRRAEDVVAAVDRRLRRRGLSRADRASITSDLLSDLRAAEADGRDLAAVLGPDLDAFAARVVADGGHRVPRARLRDVARVVLLAGLAVPTLAVVAYVLVVEVATPVLSSVFTLPGRHPVAGPAVALVAITAVGVLGVLGVMAATLAGRPEARRSLTAAAVTLTLAGAVATLCNVAVLQTAERVSPATIAVQVLLVLVPVTVAVTAARWWGLRQADADASEGTAPQRPTR